MAEPAPPARAGRFMDSYPLVADYPDHVRVMVLCTCGGLTDLTFKADLPPDTVGCAGCGTELELPGATGQAPSL